MQNISTVSALKKIYFIFLIIIFFNGVSLFHMGLINKVDMVCLSPVGYGV